MNNMHSFADRVSIRAKKLVRPIYKLWCDFGDFWEIFLFRLRYPHVKIYKKLPTYYSQSGQDVLLSALLFPLISTSSEYNTVVDIGANDPFLFSNSLYFEEFYGLRVLAVDPLPGKLEMWKKQRPNAIFEQIALGSKSGSINLRIPADDDTVIDGSSDMYSFTGDKSTRWLPANTSFVESKARVERLSFLLEKHSIYNVLFCSIDVEGMELDVISGIDFSSVNIVCFVVENNSVNSFGSDGIRIYLKKAGYTFFARLWGLDDIFIRNDFLAACR